MIIQIDDDCDDDCADDDCDDDDDDDDDVEEPPKAIHWHWWDQLGRKA